MATGRVPTTANSPLTAKGDLFGYSTTQARVAVGNDGETLVADSSTSTGLRYQAPKTQNAVYNSGFDVWQRGTSSTANGNAAATGYTADRWQSVYTSGSMTTSRQATNDTVNLPNIQYCARVQRNSGQTSTNNVIISQTLETIDSIRFTGQTVTLSFWARAGANYSGASSGLIATLVYGTGTDQNVLFNFNGSGAVVSGTKTLTTTWQRFSITGTVATTATELGYYFYYAGVGTAGANDYFEITGVQLETGSVATPFNRMSGTIQGELAACQRYYYRNVANGAFTVLSTLGAAETATSCRFTIQHPVTMRIAPTTIDFSTLSVYSPSGGTNSAISTFANVYAGTQVNLVAAGVTGLTANAVYMLYSNNSTSAYFGFSAEL